MAAAVYVCVLGALATGVLFGQYDLDFGLCGLRELLAQGGLAA